MIASQLSSMNCSTCIQASLLSISTSDPLVSIKTCIPLEMWRVAIWHQQIHTLGLPSPWQLYSSAFLSASDHNSHKACFWKQVSKFLFFSEAVNPSHSHNTSFCMTEMPKFIIHRLLLSKISSFTFSTKAILLFTFVILKLLSETDEAPSMFYFHNIYILLIETQASISRMTLKKSLFTFYNITL